MWWKTQAEKARSTLASRRRRAGAPIELETGDPRMPVLGDLEAARRDVGRDDLGLREGVAEVRQRAADAGAEVENRSRIRQAPRTPDPPDLVDFVAGEVVGALAGDRDVLGMDRQVLVGKAVELGDIHRPQPFASGPASRVTISSTR